MPENIKILTQNKKAGYDYHILETFEAGIVLRGTEMKPLRNAKVQLKDSFVDVLGLELFLIGTHIGIYEKSSYANHEPERKRKLLMHRHEIDKLVSKVQEKGLTIIPLKLYLKNGKVKVQIALVKGKKTHDKRESIKKRETNRSLAQLKRKTR